MKKRLWISMIFSTMLLAMAACGAKTASSEETQESVTDRNADFETTVAETDTTVRDGFEDGNDSAKEETIANTENIRPELVEFFESYDKFVDEYCAFLEEYYGASDNSDMESENEEMTKKKDNFSIEIRAWMDVDMTSEESDYYYNEYMRIIEKLNAGMEKAIELRDSK